MDHLSRIAIFLEVVRQGSFSAAARALGLTASAVSKQVQNLEQELGVKLLNRTTRKVAVTEEGGLFSGRARHALEDLREATEQIRELKATPRGPLKISVPMSFGVKHLARPIAAFAKAYPDVHLDIHFDDRVVDMTGENFDLSIRIGALRDSSMISRKLSACPFAVCAAPSYLAANGTPQSPADLTALNTIAYTRHHNPLEWRYRAPGQSEHTVPLSSTLKCDTAAMMIEAACAGLGLIITPLIFVQDEIKSGRLVTLLDAYQSAPERAIWALFPPNRYLSLRLRLFVDHIGNSCTAMLPG